jgi:hypothetical protein
MEKENYLSDNESGSTMQLVNKSRTPRCIVMSAIELCAFLANTICMDTRTFRVTAQSFADDLLSIIERFTE